MHRARNLLARVPTHARDEVKAAFWQIFDDITADPGQLAVDEARRRAEAFADRYGKRYPAAVACLLDSLPELGDSWPGGPCWPSPGSGHQGRPAADWLVPSGPVLL